MSVPLPSRAAEHSVHPTGGSLRVFKPFSWLEADTDKIVLSHPTHQIANAHRWTKKLNLLIGGLFCYHFPKLYG